MGEGVDKLSKLPRAFVVMGHPAEYDHPYSQKVLQILQETVDRIFDQGIPVRVTSRGPVFDTILQVARRKHRESLLQTVLFRWNGDREWNHEERYLANNYPNNTILVHDDTTQQILETYDARGYIVLPGTLGTFNRLFDLWTVIQTGKIRRKPIGFVGRAFAEPILKIFKSTLETHKPPLISSGDIEIVQIADTVDEEMAILGLPRPS